MVNPYNRGNMPWNNQMQVQSLPTQMGPTPMGTTQFGPTQMMPPVVSPTRQFVQTNVTNTVVPHVHPSHLTVVNRQMVNNQHYFPQTQSVVNECCETNTICNQPFQPCCGARGRNGRRPF